MAYFFFDPVGWDLFVMEKVCREKMEVLRDLCCLFAGGRWER